MTGLCEGGNEPPGSLKANVPAWLKSLRLHKYAQLFAQLSYEEMLALTEEQLAAQGVTKGARHKIIISIRKLRERYNTLCQLEKDVVEGDNLALALEELKAILISPIRASPREDKEREETDLKLGSGSELPAPTTAVPDEDIPAQFTKVMGKERVQAIWWYAETNSVIQVQRNFRRMFQKDPPSRNIIKTWKQHFLAMGSVVKLHGGDNVRVSEERVAAVRQMYERSPRKSVRQATDAELVHELKPDDGNKRQAFAIDMLQHIDEDPTFLTRIAFSDEATFHLSDKVNTHNTRIWGLENPRCIVEHIRDSSKLNVWCGLMHNLIIGPFFFAEQTVTRNTYLDMLDQFVVPQLMHLQPNVIFQQDGAPPHWGLIVREFLDTQFPGRWIGRDGPTRWPPRSPDITPLDFFLWGYVKNKVYTGHKIRDLEQLRGRIRDAVNSVTPEMLQKTWQEIEFSIRILKIPETFPYVYPLVNIIIWKLHDVFISYFTFSHLSTVCTQLLVSTRAEEETVRLFMWLLDHALQHEAFTPQQKRRLSSWRLQIQDAWHLSPSQHKASDQRHGRHK
ncbi:hypothetical protein ANN_27337 [Periplaneta americana]|uniref:SAM domain-containing protein n=1 Tax=Periplaneta americana TaxID=6978 RepID=A0ABQ8RXR2_PERAM|nr:hypothetical protein ANN_27337 [Periplaneta americana]